MGDRPEPPPEYLTGAEPAGCDLAAARPAIKLVELAIREHRVLDLRYRKKDGEEASLRVEPYAFRVHDGQLMVWGWDVHGGHLDSLDAAGIEDAIDSGLRFELVEDWEAHR